MCANKVSRLFKTLFIKDKAFYKMVAGIAVPIALQSLITTGVNMMDNIMIGAVGEGELSAVSLANQFIGIYQIMCMGIGMGASVLVSRYFGMKEISSIRKTLAFMTRICVGFAAVFALFTAIAPEAIMKIYSNEDDIISMGKVYLDWSVITYFFTGLSMTYTIILRCIGKVKIPLRTSIGAFFINIGANYIFIFGKLGMPEMGIAGAAIGTLIARLFEFGVICGYVLVRDKIISFRPKDVFMSTGQLWKEYFRISIPVLISDGILAFGNSAVAMVIGRLGKSFVAANAITSVTQQLSSVVIQGTAQAGAIVTGYALGEGDTEKAQRQGYALLGIGILFGMIASLIIAGISGPVISSFNVSEETEKMAGELMLAISIIVLFQSTNSIMTKGTLRGGGDTKVLMLADNIFLWAASIPLGIAAGFVFHWSAFMIYMCLKIDQILKAIWCVHRLRSGKWIKRIKSQENETVSE